MNPRVIVWLLGVSSKTTPSQCSRCFLCWLNYKTQMDAGTPRQPPAASDQSGVMVDKIEEEDASLDLGINTEHHSPNVETTDEGYDMVPNPEADVVDLSDLRGTRAPGAVERHGM